MIDPTITIGNLLTIFGFFVSVLFAWTKLDKRLALLEQALLGIVDYIVGHKREAAEDRKELEKLKISVVGLQRRHNEFS